MGEFGAVLRETWRRFWSNPVLFGWPLALALGSVMVMLLLGAMFAGAGFGGVILILLGLWAYAAMALSGLSGAWAGAARTGRAAWEEVSRGMKSYYWRMVGLLGLVGACLLVIFAILFAIMSASIAARVAAGNLDPASLQAGGLGVQVVTWLLFFGLMLLFCFAPAAIALDDVSTVNGIGRGVGLVGRRFGLVLALLVFGFVVYQLLPAGVTWPFMAKIQGTLSAAGPDGLPPAVVAALVGRLIPIVLLLAIYSCFAGSFVALSLFIAYDRNPGATQAVAPAPGAGAPPAPGGGASPAPGGGVPTPPQPPATV